MPTDPTPQASSKFDWAVCISIAAIFIFVAATAPLSLIAVAVSIIACCQLGGYIDRKSR